MPCLPLPRRVKLALRAHINHVQLLTPLVAAVARALLGAACETCAIKEF